MAITTGQQAVASDFVDTSAGAGDSGKVPKLGGAGKLDETFFGPFSNSLVGVTIDRFNALSATVQHTNAAGQSANQTNSSSYTKCAEITLNEDIDLMRIQWRIERITTSGGTATVRESAVFVNGVQVSGNVAYVSNGTVHTYDIGAGLNSGDLVQIYVRKNSTTEQYLRVYDLQICYTAVITHIGSRQLLTTLPVYDSEIDVTDTL